MKFTWWTQDGKKHHIIINNYEDKLDFIEWLEFSPHVVCWQ